MRAGHSILVAVAASATVALTLVPSLVSDSRGAARAEDGDGEPPPSEEPKQPTASGGNTKSAPDHDFEWHVPDKWESSDPSPEDEVTNNVAKSKRTLSPAAEISGGPLWRDAGPTTVDGMTAGA